MTADDISELYICTRCNLLFKPKDWDDTMCQECINEYRLQDYEESLMDRTYDKSTK